jgi:hypothetical protein
MLNGREMPLLREVSDVWDMNKDGKQYFAPDDYWGMERFNKLIRK